MDVRTSGRQRQPKRKRADESLEKGEGHGHNNAKN
jgi:hypothetical protein